MAVRNDTEPGRSRGMTEERMREKVEGLLIECIGDDQFLQAEDYEDLDLFDEYFLDMYALVDIVVAIRREFAIDISPTQVEREDVSSVAKVMSLVEGYLTDDPTDDV